MRQPGPKGGVPVYSRGLEVDDLKGSFQPKPFYDSMIFVEPSNPTDPVCLPVYAEYIEPIHS